MSVIERLARVISEATGRYEELGICTRDVDAARAVLQCLSDNIDEGGIIEASKAYCAANDYDRFNEVLDRKEPAWTDYTKEIAIAIQAYLNTINKEQK